jgi:transposase
MAQQVCVVLSAAEREQLTAIAADRNRPRKHIERAQIVLASADRHPAQQVAQTIGVSRPTVWRWQQRFAESGIDGLLRDKTRKSGKAPNAAETAARVVAMACIEPPHEATHWTSRAMAKAIGISLGSVQRIWQAHKLQPGCAPSSARAIPALRTSSLMLSGSAPALGPARGRTRGSIRRPMRWCCRSMKKARSKRSTAALYHPFESLH